MKKSALHCSSSATRRLDTCIHATYTHPYKSADHVQHPEIPITLLPSQYLLAQDRQGADSVLIDKFCPL